MNASCIVPRTLILYRGPYFCCTLCLVPVCHWVVLCAAFGIHIIGEFCLQDSSAHYWPEANSSYKLYLFPRSVTQAASTVLSATIYFNSNP
jgi:hypothetical protein